MNNVIKTTKLIEADKTRVENYAKADGMDDANKAMAVVMATKGLDAAAKAMMDDCGVITVLCAHVTVKNLKL